jgi:hypothetical protein
VLGSLILGSLMFADVAGAAPPSAKPVVPTPSAVAPVAPGSEQPPKAGADSADETDYVIEGGAVIAVQGNTRTKLALVETALAVEKEGTRLYVAAGLDGVLIFDVSSPLEPRLVERARPPSGSAVGFHRADGQIWVVLLSRSAVPVREIQNSGATPVAATAQRSDRSPPSVGKGTQGAQVAVLRATPGQIELAGGAENGVHVGDRFAVYRRSQVSGEGGDSFEGEELVTTAEVVAVTDESALAEIGRSAIVLRSDYAVRARKDQEDDDSFPPYVTQVGEASFVIRPLINAEAPLGVGVLADLEGTYWGSSWFAGLRIQPLALGIADAGTVVSSAVLLEGGFDSHAFAVGVGAGVSYVNGDVGYLLSPSPSVALDGVSGMRAQQAELPENHSAPTLSQVARLGSRDGLCLWLHNMLILHENASGQSGFVYGGTTARLNIPTGRRTDILAEGGGGVLGYWFAGVGIATWIFGNGSPGSWRISVSAGAAGIEGSKKVLQPSSTAAAPTSRAPWSRSDWRIGSVSKYAS